ncbi:MAG TPA: hypothetical protein VFM18_10445 [Methanosarcina sp.]|nr:hypothetical protein [Methanosarcina sp.]
MLSLYNLYVVITILLLIQLNYIVGLVVGSYIKKTRNADLGIANMSFVKRYCIYHVLALLFYAISLLAALTGRSFDEVF